MWGLEHSEVDSSVPTTVKSRIARYSYGICAAVPFLSGVHQFRDSYKDPSTGVMLASNQMIWFIQKVSVLPLVDQY